MSMAAPYPWQQAQWQALQPRRRTATLPPALLLSRPAGLGKLDFARRLAKSLLCEHPGIDGEPCCQCRSCRLFDAGSHPDFQLTQPLDVGKEITVGAIRELVAYQTLTPQYGRGRVAIIEPAERMNGNAANALLKTLEEPTAGTVLLLVAARPAMLLPTIRSRCQQLLFPPQHTGAALDWLAGQLGDGGQAALTLAIADGAPLRARAMAEEGAVERRHKLFDDFVATAECRKDPVAVAAEWNPLPTTDILWTVIGWYADMVRLRIVGPSAQLSNPDLRERLQALTEHVDLADLFQQLERLQETLRLMRGQLNSQLVCEELLLGWSSSACRAARTR